MPRLGDVSLIRTNSWPNVLRTTLAQPFFRLQSGWSVKTANLDKWRQPDPMSTDEHEKILEVIEKAEAMERAEMQRVG